MVEAITAVRFTATFKKHYQRLPPRVREQFDRQLGRLLEDRDYPSLRIKKIQGTADIWEGSVTMQYRFTFTLADGIATLRNIGSHDILKNP
jgi:mRNA-degrading endonuclease RelE of RelBE toxin-antitoxin system